MSKQSSKLSRPKAASGDASTTSVAQRNHAALPRITLQRDAHSHRGHSGPEDIDTSTVSDVLKSPGQPLDAATRARMEPQFGYDFSRVRVHTDAQAAMSAQSVHAKAYTAGQNLVFGAGQYAPHSTQGQRLMAHELTHVVQQASGPVAGTPVADGMSVSHPSDAFEQSARSNALRIENADYPGAGRRADLRPLPTSPTSSTHGHDVQLQRSTADDAAVASAGIAGAGLLAGIIGTVFSGQSAAAAGRQADAAEAASVGAATAGGLVINHADIPASAGSSAAPAAAGAAASTETELPTVPLMRIGIGEAVNDFAVIGVALRTNGTAITGGQTETISSDGYVGGLSGNNLFMQLRARSSPPVNGKDVTRIEYEGNNNPARHGSSSRIQRFNGVIKVDATGAILGKPAQDAHANGGDSVQENPSGQPPVPVRITTPPETR